MLLVITDTLITVSITSVIFTVIPKLNFTTNTFTHEKRNQNHNRIEKRTWL